MDEAAPVSIRALAVGEGSASCGTPPVSLAFLSFTLVATLGGSLTFSFATLLTLLGLLYLLSLLALASALAFTGGGYCRGGVAFTGGSG
jgi:hypothetical protein